MGTECYTERQAACPHFLAASVSGERGENDEIKRGEMKKKILLHDTIVVAPAVPVIQYRTRRVCLSQQRHINIVIVYERVLSILSEKRWNQTRRTASWKRRIDRFYSAGGF